jgi:hypothetical protein
MAEQNFVQLFQNELNDRQTDKNNCRYPKKVYPESP